MNSLIPVAPGVMLRERWKDAAFESGSLRELALGIKRVFWTHLDLFKGEDEAVIYIGGDQKESEEDRIELELSGYTAPLAFEVSDELESIRRANLPNRDCARWPCDCDVYCDQSHGEGRLEFHVARPSFHELAAWQVSLAPDPCEQQSKQVSGAGKAAAIAASKAPEEMRLRNGAIVRIGDTVRARGEDNRLRTCRIVDIFPESGSAQALLTAPWPFGTVIRAASQIYLPRHRKC